MKRHLVLLTTAVKRAVFTVLCGALLILFASPAWADPCSAPTIGPAVNTSNFSNPVPTCGVVITILASSMTGNVQATITGTAVPYDNADDELVGIQNNSALTVGAIVLSGTPNQDPFGFDRDGPCFYSSANCFTNFPVGYVPSGYEGPDNTFIGISPDTTTGKVLFTSPIPPNQSTWFAMEGIPNAVTAVGENWALTAGLTTTFPFGPFSCSGSGGSQDNVPVDISCGENSSGKDALQLTPVNSATGETITVAPIPVPAGPLGLDNWGAGNFGSDTNLLPLGPGQVRFSATNYSTPTTTLACVPYADFSARENPVCVELELDCTSTDACPFVYTATADFNIDANSLPNGIGGAHFLGQHDGNPSTYNGQCPTPDFNIDIFESYTATNPDPITGGGRGNSCFVTAFDPTATVVPPGTTVSTFFGFEFPVFDNKVNPVFVGLPVPLSWDFHNSLGQPVTNLSLCKAVNSDGTCATSGVSAPWVYLALIALSSTTACQNVAKASSPLPSVFNSGLLNFGKGEYSFVWNTLTKITGLSGCQVRVVAQFDNNGLVVAPAVFQYH